MHILQQTKQELLRYISGKMVLELQGMESLIVEYKLQADEKNKNGKK